MIPETVLTFAGGSLRALRPDDVHAGYVAGLNDPDVNRYLDGVKRVVQTRQSIVEFVRSNRDSANSVLWGLWQAGSEHHCGTVRLHGIEHFHNTAHIGICVFDKSAWGKHLGSEAIRAVTQWALDNLCLRWVEAGVYAENISSQKAFLSAGYEWIYDIPGKYVLAGKPTTVKVFAASLDFKIPPAAPISA